MFDKERIDTEMADNGINEVEGQVRSRLLDAAERLFCEKGFDGTSIRDLTAEAECNLAAVNYHFGGKEKLYMEVFRRRMLAMRDYRISVINEVMSGGQGQVRLEDLLGAFVKAFIQPFVEENGGVRFTKLMAREMFEPHLPRSVILEEMVFPVLTVLEEALAKVCPGLDGDKAVLCIHSLIGQLLHVIRTREVFAGVEGQRLAIGDLGQVIGHIVKFSAAGIRAAGKAGQQD